MALLSLCPEPFRDHLLFRENGTWYSGILTKQYQFPAFEVRSTDRRWEGKKIIYVHQHSPVFVLESWLRRELTVYGIHRELAEYTILPPVEKIKLFCEREILQENYQPHHQKQQIY